MRYLSLFSGIEAASVAWAPLGWQCVGVSEIAPFPCAVLAHRYPSVPNLGDVTRITDAQIAALGRIDIVVGGSPCQDLSVAGKRAGLAGERSGLFHEQLRIFHAARAFCGARFLVWENVTGVLSSRAGRDFAVVVGEMAGCRLPVPADGWGTEGMALGEHGLVEWAVLDAQWFGVAQRRRRVFAVLDVGDWSVRPPILLERDSLRGDSAPSREAGEGATGIAGGGPERGSWWDGGQVSQTLDAVLSKGQTMPDKHRFPAVLVPAVVLPDVVGPLMSGHTPNGHGCAGVDSQQVQAGHTIPVAFMADDYKDGGYEECDTARPLTTSADRTRAAPIAVHRTAVRRLTPRECERLQGFPDDWTAIPWRGKPAEQCPGGPRYTAIGNSMAVPVMLWIGQQIKGVI